MDKTELRKITIRLFLIYFVCVSILTILILMQNHKAKEWIEANEDRIEEKSGKVVDRFVAGRASKMVIELSDGNRITLNDDPDYKGKVTVYAYSQDGINYYTLSKGSLYITSHAAARRGFVFIGWISVISPLIWYLVKLSKLEQKSLLNNNQNSGF